ncbi:MAG: POTRA domain-containing protein [Rhodothermales bacterium]|nr:POTRA domain-containing protein [Rhodothermales bacterium]
MLLWVGADAAAQAGSATLRWQTDDGRQRREVKPQSGWHPDSLGRVSRDIVALFHRRGHYLAEVDSIRRVGTDRRRAMVVYVAPGPEIRVGAVRIHGAAVVSPESLRSLMKTRSGRLLDPQELEEDVANMLDAYVELGYVLTTVRIQSITVEGDPAESSLGIDMAVDEGEPVVLGAIELAGAARTRPYYVERLLGLRAGDPLTHDLDALQQRLEETMQFARVDRPALYRLESGAIGLRVGLEEASPGVFDLVLGYQPPTGGGRAQGLVGNGNLHLRNLFGGGREMALRLNRLPGQISQLDASFRDPFVAKLPVQLELNFEGLQQDSTYGQQRYDGALGYRLPGGLELLLTLSREVTRPGFAGAQLVAGQQRIARADAFYAGATVRFRRVDRPANPRRGLVVETRFERGLKERATFNAGVAGDTVRSVTLGRQERLHMQARVYLPTLPRQVAVIGNATSAVIGEALDESDLFRFGGAASLRGYEEDRFRGQVVNRSFVEYRYQFERASFAYLFFDLGYVDRSALQNVVRQKAVYPGYGFGFQFETAMGIINTSFALSPEDTPTDAKVHVGLSVGL